MNLNSAARPIVDVDSIDTSDAETLDSEGRRGRDS